MLSSRTCLDLLEAFLQQQECRWSTSVALTLVCLGDLAVHNMLQLEFLFMWLTVAMVLCL